MPVCYHEGFFPPKNIDLAVLAPHIESATVALARYDSFLGMLPNPRILVSPMLIQEAVTSSKIEGTRATVSEVLEYEAGNTDVEPSLHNDIQEIANYQVALELATQMMDELPISGRMLRAAHRTLLSNVRGRYKSPGLYRTDQNWIGAVGSNLETAKYVPVAPEHLDDAMARWERYVNSEGPSKLLKIAIAHAEFESIHPFCDGNGRIGRMLVPLMLWQEEFIGEPCFYVSEVIEQRDAEYRDALLAVSRDDNWTDWCSFFLDILEKQATVNDGKVRAIFKLNENWKRKLTASSGSAHASDVVDAIFCAPVFSGSALVKRCGGIQPHTVRRLLKCLCELGCLKELTPAHGRKSAIYCFEELLRITEGIA